MKFKVITPGEKLRPFIKFYWLLESEEPLDVEDTLVPSGCMEICFNLGEAEWESATDNVFYTSPQVELMGQITRPMAFRVKGRNTMLGIRFFPHTPAYFFSEAVCEFNDQISDCEDALGEAVRSLHARLKETPGLRDRVALIERFLLRQLSAAGKKTDRIKLVGDIARELQRSARGGNIEAIADRYGITSRYLQKLFLQHIGVTPKVYSKISRFQHSLEHLGRQEGSLTAIAYACGYADQSHFIREFKSFTGVTPSAWPAASIPVYEAIGS